MSDIGDRIFELARVERAARPVGKAGALVQRDPQPVVDQIGIADLLALADRHGGDLGVEDRVRRLAGQIVDDLHILAAGVKNLEHIFIVDQQFEQRTEVDALGQRIDRGGFLAV